MHDRAMDRTSTGQAFAGIDFDRARLFDTADLDEARELCGRVFNPHRLSVTGAGQRLRSRMAHIRFGALSLNCLTWGAAVDVDPDRLAHYYLLSMPVQGHAVFHHGGRSVDVAPRCAGLVSAAPRFRFSATPDFEQIVVRLERASLDDAWLALAGRPPDTTLDFECGMPLDGTAWAALEPALRLLAAGVRGDFAAMGLPHLAARVEEQLATALLLHQPHSLSTSALAHVRTVPRHQRHAEEWMSDRLGEPITLSGVARACGVSTRSLQASFQQARGMGPMQWLRGERLSAVRAALLAASQTRPSIAQMALRFGFTHLGEFSRAYRSMFGESPRDTVARRG
jgi:AraC-like DNA-binding protein